MHPQIETLRRKGLSVTSIARMTGAPASHVAAHLGVMWDGREPHELRAELHEAAKRQQAIDDFNREQAARAQIIADSNAAAVAEARVSWKEAMGATGWRPVAERPVGSRRVWMHALLLASRETGCCVVAAANHNDRRVRITRTRHIARRALHMRGNSYMAVALMSGVDHTTIRAGVLRVMKDAASEAAARRVAAAMGRKVPA